nr:hypothetical protein [Abalone asfa-like virus]
MSLPLYKLFRLTAPVYWILVSLHSGYSPTLKDGFTVTTTNDQLIRIRVPIYYMTYNDSLYIVLSQNQKSNHTHFYIKNSMWKKTYQNNLEIIGISSGVNSDYFTRLPIRTPDPKLFNSIFDSIPSNYTPPKHVRNLFLDKFNLPQYTDLPPLTNG